jgi:hypothetical protein
MEHDVDGEILEFVPPLALVRVGAVIIRGMHRRHLGPELNDVDVEARHGAPEVPPAC